MAGRRLTPAGKLAVVATVRGRMKVEGDDGPLELAMAEDGRGGSPLLLVHGFTGAKEDFTAHLGLLAAAGWHAVAPDLRGHGASDAPDDEGAYDLALLAGDLLALADTLGWESFVLLGHSMGGMVAQVAALVAPGRLEGLVLMDTGPCSVGVDRDLADLSVDVVRSGGMALLGEVVASLPEGSPLDTTAARRLRQSRPSPLGGDDFEASWAAFADAKLHAASPAMYAAMVPAMLDQLDRSAALASLAVPTLVVAGEHDALFLDDCRHLAATIPGARLEIIAGAGHNPQHEAPETWSVVLLDFLAGLARPSRAADG
jgi:pimeloyl-ACP methyl ester carboxylesterase